MKPTMTPDDLQRAGFERYGVHRIDADSKKALYQKTIRAADGTRLFSVNVYEMRLPETMPAESRDVYRWAITAQLYRDSVTMDLDLHHVPGMTPADVEAFYRGAHAALGCTRDPHND